MPPLRSRAAKPSDMTADERQEFADLVRLGGEVATQGLPERIDRAITLITLRKDEALVGVAAIKAPSDDYRHDQFTKAGVPERANDYPTELGWIVVHEQYRGEGYARMLVETALAAAVDNGVYATTKSESIRHILPDYGFIIQGSGYASELEPDVQLTLLARLA
jgi:GNAT superfamily N-acetyltransferase